MCLKIICILSFLLQHSLYMLVWSVFKTMLFRFSILLLISCQLLKKSIKSSQYDCNFIIFSLGSVNFHLIYVKVILLGICILTTIRSSWFSHSFVIMQCSSLSLIIFSLMSTLSYVSGATSDFFWLISTHKIPSPFY